VREKELREKGRVTAERERVDFRSALMHMLCLITYKVRSENGCGFLRSGLKTGVGNGIFWSEIGSGFGDAGGTPPPKIPRSTPPGVSDDAV